MLLNVTMFLQHKTDFAAKWTVTPRLHSFTSSRAGSGHLTSMGKTALHHPRDEGCSTNTSFPTKPSLGGKIGLEVRQRALRAAAYRSWGEQWCSVSMQKLLGGNSFPHTPTGPVHKAAVTAARLVRRELKALGFLACRAVCWSNHLSNPTSVFGRKAGTEKDGSEEDGSGSSLFPSWQNIFICRNGFKAPEVSSWLSWSQWRISQLFHSAGI